MEFEATTGNINDDWESFFPRCPLVLLEKKNQILDEISGGFVKMGLVRLRARFIFKIRRKR